MTMVRLLHTSDVHLDAALGHLADRGTAYRERVRGAFTRIMEAAASDHDVLVIAGDLFDIERPYASTVAWAQSELARIGIPVFIVAGNHDHLSDHSVYATFDWPDNVHVFRRAGETIALPELDLALTGFPLTRREDATDSSISLAGSSAMRCRVAIAHGWVSERGTSPEGAAPMRLEGCEPGQVDYVALGHLHTAAEARAGSVPVWYSGAPEPVRNRQPQCGVVLSVELSPGGVEVRPLTVGSLKRDRTELNVTGLDYRGIQDALLGAADPDRMLTVELVGLRDRCPDLDVDALRALSAADFFELRIRDRTQFPVSLEHMAAEERTPLLEAFAESMRSELAMATTDEGRARVLQAFQLGINELTGRRTV